MLVGTVVAGLGLATVEHDDGRWDAFGYRPWPGTLNLTVDGPLPAWLTSRPPVRWQAERAEHMTVFWPCTIGGIGCHVRANVTAPQVEVVAAVHLRTVLGLSDGDRVRIV